MKRKLMMVERIMHVDASTPLNCVFTVKIAGSINAENLHTALAKVQQKHPLLRVQIDEEQKGGPYFITNEQVQSIPVRIAERVTDDDWLKESETEWYKLFDGENVPLARIVWIRSAVVSELLLVMPHCVCDGGTCIALLREILSLLDNPEQELDTYAPFNSVQELMPDSFDIAKNKRKGRIYSFLGRLFFLFKSTRSKFEPGRNYAIHWKLDEEYTLAIAEACKNAGTSVHAALCVAFLKAFQKVRGGKARGKVISPVDIRRFIPEIKPDTMFAFAPIVELTVDKDPGMGFWDQARKIKTDLTTKIENMNAYEMLWMGEYMHKTVKRMIGFLKTTDGSHDVTLSNMGRLTIPEKYQLFEVETIYSPTVAFPWRNPNTLVTTTFKNRMDFTFMSNDNFLEEAEALKIKAAAMELLFANLQQLSHA
ncbi:condensation domain-containing protein [Mucilaginibacter sp. RCC_168]|uniref:phthiocerol/phthiodiolone dimycocerosyl transferase family protein n=1 Tax=Mucilaginibacter sp. RCC_168 TaxID=3239221 RepID=UPI0035257F32